jgi:predicted dehydrogenase
MRLAFRLLAATALVVALAALTFHTRVAAGTTRSAAPQEGASVRLMTLDPGHFHAALVQKSMYPGVAPRVDVFAPLGSDLVAHLNRVSAYNNRAQSPTAWQLEVHAGPDFFERMIAERPGNVVVLSGRNGVKIDRILGSVRAGLHVLADKPWILRSEQLPQLEAALADADANGIVAYDIMTERFEITTILQKMLVNDRSVFGDQVAGTADEPGVYMESIHHLMKVVSGAPNIRPAWFFDTTEQGEGLNDIGTHLVDLAQWTLFPDQEIDYKADVRVLDAQRWPTRIPEADFKRVTASAGFPAALAPNVKGGVLDYYCNTLVHYTVRGVHVGLNIIWDWEAEPGSGDRHYAVYRGSRSRIEVRQGKADNFKTQLYIVPATASARAAVRAAVETRITALAAAYPGIAVEDAGADIHVTIPDVHRVDHESHFAQVTGNFLSYVEDRHGLPAWERANMLAKYFVTTTGTELSRTSPAREAKRIAP